MTQTININNIISRKAAIFEFNDSDDSAFGYYIPEKKFFNISNLLKRYAEFS